MKTIGVDLHKDSMTLVVLDEQDAGRAWSGGGLAICDCPSRGTRPNQDYR